MREEGSSSPLRILYAKQGNQTMEGISCLSGGTMTKAIF